MFLNQNVLYLKRPQGMKSKSNKIDKSTIPNDRNFFEDVFDVVRQIPKGRVTNYGSIAKYLGSGLSSRMVGWAMNASHGLKPAIPAQRVVNRNGLLTGKNHFSTQTQMQELLEKDGVQVIDDKVVEFKSRYWDPEQELS